MADYDWGKGCCGQTIGHKRSCPEHLEHEAYLYEQRRADEGAEAGGFKYVIKLDMYRCMRGCGCLVWNIRDHMKNVCPSLGGD